VIHCTGHLRQLGGGSTSPPAGRVMTLLCEPIPHPSSVEFPLDTCPFLTRHNMDLRFTHCEGREKKGSPFGRKNGGGFVWAETQATVLYSSRMSLPEAVVCLNFIFSDVEQPGVVFSVEQTRCGRLPEAEPQPAEDSGISDLSQSDSGSKCLTSPGQSEDAGSIPSPVAELFLQVKEELLKEASELEDPITPLTGDLLELSFCSPRGQSSVPELPQDLCTPQLRQLLSPIFSPLTPPSSSSPCSSPEDQLSPCEEGGGTRWRRSLLVQETERERHWRYEQNETLHVSVSEQEVMDLDMLAPYISMDDDFQLSVLSSVPEDDKPSSSKASAGRPADPASRKRVHNPDEELLMIQDKRQKVDPSSVEEELLLSHRLLDCLEEINQSDCFVQPGPAHRQRPCSGGLAGTL
ncbi:hypoxia-inducible factor 1-alpha-like, partial [Notothenia coriiceps]|uniref:Hypoxia-inducible factor 1-alpha-like n=1 Tax=Notothenia coriiceps TaxID=8208 RepID=A0A6I9NCK5_9TELE